jgi:hypothetical protein
MDTRHVAVHAVLARFAESLACLFWEQKTRLVLGEKRGKIPSIRVPPWWIVWGAGGEAGGDIVRWRKRQYREARIGRRCV